MKSQITSPIRLLGSGHENQKNKLQSLSKKLLVALAVFLGTTVIVSAQTTPAQVTPSKEVKATKKEVKKETKKAHKAEASKPVATPAESAAAKK